MIHSITIIITFALNVCDTLDSHHVFYMDLTVSVCSCLSISDEEVKARQCQKGVIGNLLPGDFLMKTAQDVMGLFWPKQ